MKNDKKLLSLAMFMLMMTGCGIVHMNTVKNVSGNSLLLEDVETHQERIVVLGNSNYNAFLLNYTYPGDTVEVRTRNYENFVLKESCSTKVGFYADSIDSRYNRDLLQTKKQEMISNKTR